jgi:hypothetical protein
LARGRTRGGENQDIWSEAQLAAHRGIKGHVSLCVSALESATWTSGNAMYMNLHSETMRSCIQAVVTRNFTSPHFHLALLVAQVPGTPSVSELMTGFGEADDCKIDGNGNRLRTEAEDRRMYPHLRSAITVMAVLDTPTLDFGFQTTLLKLARDIQTFEANGTPMSSVTRDVCKTLLNALSRREREIGGSAILEGGLISYRDTPTLTASRARMLTHTRESTADEMSRWMLLAQRAGLTGTIVPAPEFNPAGSPAKRPTPPKKAPTPQVKREPKTPKKGQGTPNAGGPGAPQRPKGAWTAIDQRIWREKYGVGSNGDKLCFFYANKPGGCIKDGCTWSHDELPARYEGSQFAGLGDDKRAFIIENCKRT